MMARQPIQHTDSDIPSGRVNPEGIQKATAIRRNPPPPEPDPAPTQSMPTSPPPPPPPPATQSPPAPAQPAAAGHRRVLRPRQGTRTELVMDQRTTRLMDDSLYVIADKIGVMLARDLSKLHPDAKFVVDVKSTGLFHTDPVLKAQGVVTEYWKTGHSYIKRRVNELGALAGFEKSGHFFFNTPIGRGYDDGVLTAIHVAEMLDRNPDKSMADLYRAIPKTGSTPTMSGKCADEVKYGVVERVTARFQTMRAEGAMVGGQPIVDLITVNGIRVVAQDGTWGLVRASSNKPELVVVIESPVSEARMREMFAAVDGLLRENPEVGAYNQSI
jgi:phosphomannomutase/phosphoglucomutase